MARADHTHGTGAPNGDSRALSALSAIITTIIGHYRPGTGRRYQIRGVLHTPTGLSDNAWRVPLRTEENDDEP